MTSLILPPTDRCKDEQQIFQRMMQIVEEAEQFVLVDMFLFNNYQHKGQNFPPVSTEFTEALVTKKISILIWTSGSLQMK